MKASYVASGLAAAALYVTLATPLNDYKTFFLKRPHKEGKGHGYSMQFGPFNYGYSKFGQASFRVKGTTPEMESGYYLFESVSKQLGSGPNQIKVIVSGVDSSRRRFMGAVKFAKDFCSDCHEIRKEEPQVISGLEELAKRE